MLKPPTSTAEDQVPDAEIAKYSSWLEAFAARSAHSTNISSTSLEAVYNFLQKAIIFLRSSVAKDSIKNDASLLDDLLQRANSLSATNYIRQGRLKDSIFLNPTSEEEIRNIIKLLKNGSSGWDEISAKIIKISCSPLLKPLCQIFNLSLFTGVFPDELKLAKVVPLYKAGDAKKFSNYRPV